MTRKAIVVLGMHRSGTSALTGTLCHLGAYPGSNLIPPDEDVNPKGYWEHAEISAINEAILNHLGTAWDDIHPLPNDWWNLPGMDAYRGRLSTILQTDFHANDLIILKDPRLCRLLPMWDFLLSSLEYQPLYILCMRSPSGSASSIKQRDGMHEPEACLLWVSYMLDAEFYTRDRVRVVVPYEKLLFNWREVVDEIASAFTLIWPVSLDRIANTIEAFIDPGLRHHVDSHWMPNHPACRLAEKTFKALSDRTLDHAAMEYIREEAGALEALVIPWQSSATQRRMAREYKIEAQNLEESNRRLRDELVRMKSTLSWRLTGPLRATWNYCRKVLGDKP